MPKRQVMKLLFSGDVIGNSVDILGGRSRHAGYLPPSKSSSKDPVSTYSVVVHPKKFIAGKRAFDVEATHPKLAARRAEEFVMRSEPKYPIGETRVGTRYKVEIADSNSDPFEPHTVRDFGTNKNAAIRDFINYEHAAGNIRPTTRAVLSEVDRRGRHVESIEYSGDLPDEYQSWRK